MLSWLWNRHRTDKTTSGSRTSEEYGGEHVNEGGRPVRIQCYEGDMEYDLDGPVNDSHTTNDANAENMEVTFEKSNRQNDQEGFSRRSKLICVAVCLVLILGAIIATPVALAKSKSTSKNAVEAGDTTTDTDSPTMAPTFTERFGDFYDLVSMISTEGLDDEDSPQYEALRWIVNEDEANITLDTTFATHAIERYAVATLYFATNGDNWLNLNDTFLSPDSVCDWNDSADSGVFCDGDGFVNRISIVSNGLQGSIPNELAALHHMETLNLYYNSLKGPLPDLSSLTSLETVDVDGNNLSGEVPTSIFNLPSLKFLFLLNNPGLTGTMPEFDYNSQLESISLYDCSLSGTIPESLGNVTTLRRIQFYNNSFSGTIPSSLARLSGLETLGLRKNQLTGNLPLFNGLTSLSSLSVGENMLDGTMPALQDLDALEYLFLQDNQMVGQFPSTLGSLPSLTQLWVSNNEFDGSLPELSGNPGILSLAFFNGNKLTGGLDQFLQSAPDSVEWLDISSNDLQDSLSSNIQRFSSLKLFNASNSGLIGRLPTQIGLLSQAETLDLSNNQLTGQITSEFGDMARLEYMDLSFNFLGGALPAELGNLFELTHLDVSNNLLGFEFPSSSLSLNANLESLAIQKNQFTGDLTSICLGASPPAVLTADCGGAPPMIQCYCCTECFE